MVWFRHVMKMNLDDFVRKVYESRILEKGVRGSPPAKWINRVDEYWRNLTSEGLSGKTGKVGDASALKGSSCEGTGHQRNEINTLNGDVGVHN